VHLNVKGDTTIANIASLGVRTSL